MHSTTNSHGSAAAVVRTKRQTAADWLVLLAMASLGLAELGCQCPGGCSQDRMVRREPLPTRPTMPLTTAVPEPLLTAKPEDDSEIILASAMGAQADAPEVRTDRLEAIAAKLKAVADNDAIQFQFDVLTHQKPRIYHSRDGRIYVTTGLLDQIESREELAQKLALEMGRLLAELEEENSVRGQAPSMGIGGMHGPATGPDDLAREHMLVRRATSGRTPQVIAREILRQADLGG